MDYQGDIIRPPSEANSIILQVTLGCSHNRCTFCGAYRDKQYAVKPWSVIAKDIAFAKLHCTRLKTLFLADGDALAMDHDDLIRLLTTIKTELPWVRRVATYATCQNVLDKTAAQLGQYYQLGLQRLYLGLESGHAQTLKRIVKGADPSAMVKAAHYIKNAGMFLSVTCLLGIAGAESSPAHAKATAEVLNQMQPNQVAVLTLMILPNTPLYKQVQSKTFTLPSQQQLFEELRQMLFSIDFGKTQFQANHASNYFSLSGRLPKDKAAMLATIDNAINGMQELKPESCRLL
ncbi:MAG: radical SAM protein [Desulfobulbus propionicus]|nr:MAG: radical SAM protein [Desulfobulbus propionicus]